MGKILSEWPTTESTVKVAFFDADLTLRSTARMSGKSPLSPQDQIIYPDVAERIRSLNEAGYFVAIVSNQGRVRTSDDWKTQKQIFESLVEDLAKQGARVDYANIDGFWNPLNRKPNLGLYNQLNGLFKEKNLRIDPFDSFMVGDAGFTKDDIPAQENAINRKDHTTADLSLIHI